MKRLTQKQLILRHMKKNRTISKVSAKKYGIANLRARICELRNDLCMDLTVDDWQVYTQLKKFRGTNGNKVGVYSQKQPKGEIYFS